jgi:predicted dehydrogenase
MTQQSTINSHLPTARILRIALVGCGKIADQHVHAIRRIPDCVIVGLCDRELLMAKQLGERFGINACFADFQEMLETTAPDVVHITTPPQSHYTIAKECMQAGSHVYLEKPFTITASEAQSLIDFAQKCALKVTVGHNYLFTLEMLEMRRLIKKGFLGERPIHVESYWSYDLGDKSYVAPMLGNRDHWLRQLPGQLFHNIISHGIAKLAEFLDDEPTEIVSKAHQSEQLRSLGAQEVMDELRVLMRDRTGTTASFVFSTEIKGLNQLRIYGPTGSIVVDQTSGSIIRNRYRPHKSYLTYFIPPLQAAREHFRNARVNMTNFLRQRLYQDFGMKELIERFYNSIRLGSQLPIPYREILLTARIMDEIFAQIYPSTGQTSDIRGQTVATLPAHIAVSSPA